MTLTLGFSPCPNDCFMFDAMVHRRIDLEGLDFDVRMADIEALNSAAFAGGVDITKLSFHAFAYCADDYVLLDAGSALGRNCGPLLISQRPISPEEVAAGDLRIAIPGKYTTANFLLSLAFPRATDKSECLFSDIEAGVLDGRFDAGLIIHESRFTYADHGLARVIDLGEWWESETGLPVPLAGICARAELDDALIAAAERAIRESVQYAFDHPDASREYVRVNAQEMSGEVCAAHIALYVNEHSLDVGDDGMRAIARLVDLNNA